MRSTGKPDNGSLKLDGTRIQGLYRFRGVDDYGRCEKDSGNSVTRLEGFQRADQSQVTVPLSLVDRIPIPSHRLKPAKKRQGLLQQGYSVCQSELLLIPTDG